MSYPYDPNQYQTPMDPVQAAQQARDRLTEIARQQQEAQRRAAEQQQQEAQKQGGVSGAVGGQIMDSILGGGGGVGEAGVSGAGAAGEAGVVNAGAAGEIAAPAAMPGPAGIIAGGYTGYQQAKGAQALAQRKDPSLIQHAALFPVTGGFSFLSKAPGFSQKSTKDREKERWGSLVKSEAPEDKAYNESIVKLGNAAHGPEADEERWKEIRGEAMKSAPDMWGQFGMLNTFKKDYFEKMSEFQRFAATQYAIDNGLLKEDHGDIIVTDPERLRAALEEFTSNKDYQAMYEAWKKGGEKQVGTQQMDEATKAPASSGGGGGSTDFDAALSGSLKSLRDQSAASARRERGVNLMKMAAQPTEPAQIQSSPVRTGVESLDAILGSVLS